MPRNTHNKVIIKAMSIIKLFQIIKKYIKSLALICRNVTNVEFEGLGSGLRSDGRKLGPGVGGLFKSNSQYV